MRPPLPADLSELDRAIAARHRTQLLHLVGAMAAGFLIALIFTGRA